MKLSLFGAVLVALVPLGAMAAAPAPPSPQPHAYWHVWADKAGRTHQSQCAFKDFAPFSLGSGIEPIYVDKVREDVGAVWIAQLPKGWVGQWHENPKAQWVVPLKGRWFVETTDGHRVEMGPGEASLGEDQAAKPDASGHTGHLSGTLGDEPTTLMFVQLKQPVAHDDACQVR